MKRYPLGLKGVCALALCLSLTVPALAVEEAERKPLESVGWAELEDRIRNGSTSALALSENIAGIEAMDYEKMYEDLRKQLNEIANAQWMLTMAGDSASSKELGQVYDTLRDTFDSIKDGDLQEDNADLVWQLKDANNQLVAAGENLYIMLLGLEQSATDGARGLAALDRTLEEMRLRRSLGQISQQTIEDLEQTREDTASQLQTLDHTISTYKGQLQSLMGEEPTGTLALEALPEEDLTFDPAPPYEEALASAKEASWVLRSAQITLDEAKETWKDAVSSCSASSYRYTMAEHAWKGAQLTYQGEVQSFETSFRTLYDAPADCRQIWESKEAAVRHQERLVERAQAKYDLGLISRSALLSAQDELAAAQSVAEGAQRDLFAAQNNLRLAIRYGLVK